MSKAKSARKTERMPAARPTERLISRALAAWTNAGLAVGGIEVRPDGSIRILAPGEAKPVPSSAEGQSCDDIFGVSD